MRLSANCSIFLLKDFTYCLCCCAFFLYKLVDPIHIAIIYCEMSDPMGPIGDGRSPIDILAGIATTETLLARNLEVLPFASPLPQVLRNLPSQFVISLV